VVPVEIWVIALVVVVVALSDLAQRLSLPYPIVLVLGGAVLGFVPGLPAVHLEPELVLVVFLPPLLYNPTRSHPAPRPSPGRSRWVRRACASCSAPSAVC
jgi:NhaP-type Na+/H+ or K+/H+ antiporter